MADVKLCKDCKHFTPNTEELSLPFLHHKYAVCALTSKVTGFDGPRCSERRKWSFFGKCGPNGKQWEAKNG